MKYEKSNNRYNTYHQPGGDPKITFNFNFWIEDEIVNPTLFSEEAEEIAKKLYQEGKQKNNNKLSQIRKFYDELLKYKILIKVKMISKNIMLI